MIRGKPLSVQPGYKWGKADAVGIGDENDVYLVTTGLGGGLDQEVAARVANAVNLHDEMLEALRFYANPDIYKPHPHGPAFDYRDRSYVAVAAIAKAEAK